MGPLTCGVLVSTSRKLLEEQHHQQQSLSNQLSCHFRGHKCARVNFTPGNLLSDGLNAPGFRSFGVSWRGADF